MTFKICATLIKMIEWKKWPHSGANNVDLEYAFSACLTSTYFHLDNKPQHLRRHQTLTQHHCCIVPVYDKLQFIRNFFVTKIIIYSKTITSSKYKVNQLYDNLVQFIGSWWVKRRIKKHLNKKGLLIYLLLPRLHFWTHSYKTKRFQPL